MMERVELCQVTSVQRNSCGIHYHALIRKTLIRLTLIYWFMSSR